MMRVRFACLLLLALETVLMLSDTRRMVNLVPPIRKMERSQSMINTERGKPLKALNVNNRIMMTETSTDALVTANRISLNSFVLAYPHRRR